MTAYPQKSKNDISLFSDNIDKLALYIDFLDDIFTLKSGSYAFVLLCESYCLITFNVGGNRESRSYLTVYLDYYFNGAVNTFSLVKARPLSRE